MGCSSSTTVSPKLQESSKKIFPVDDQKYALLVINTHDLYNALGDALAQVALLLHWGFDKSNIVILVDTDSDPRLDILSNFSTIISNNGHDFISKYNEFFSSFSSKIGDSPASLYIGISGHGGQTIDLSGDEPDGLDEFITPAGVIILDDQITEPLKNLNSNVTILAVTDACHSATMFDDIQLSPKIIRLSSASDDTSSGEVYCDTTKLVQYLATLGSSTLDFRNALNVLITGVLTASLVKYGFYGVSNNTINNILNSVSTATTGQNRDITTNTTISWFVFIIISLIIFTFLIIFLFWILFSKHKSKGTLLL